ncbi:hypothetical protein PoB_006758700 [Plakobranchus ocellatus]|uniref:Uncharacterized protein n=1 Tax=Plakobranchus ocellatus TaxID=259542 RepID=A0AAV4DA55_9GAST|nr:hypothetical protein PoB_006758700 [Plakobranchus ocellatus]
MPAHNNTISGFHALVGPKVLGRRARIRDIRASKRAGNYALVSADLRADSLGIIPQTPQVENRKRDWFLVLCPPHDDLRGKASVRPEHRWQGSSLIQMMIMVMTTTILMMMIDDDDDDDDDDDNDIDNDDNDDDVTMIMIICKEEIMPADTMLLTLCFPAVVL